MKWLLIIPAIFAGIVLAVLIFGALQPVKHSVTRSIFLPQKPEVVFAILENAAELTNWSSAIAKTEALPSRDGKQCTRCTLRWGSMQMIVEQIESARPSRLVNRMTRQDGPVLGTWTYRITPENSGCRISITEEGELNNPFYRAMAKARGFDANIKQTLADLAKKFGATATLRDN